MRHAAALTRLPSRDPGFTRLASRDPGELEARAAGGRRDHQLQPRVLRVAAQVGVPHRPDPLDADLHEFLVLGVLLPEVGAQPALALVNGGGYAEYCIADEGSCLPVPEGISLVEAAGIPEGFFTVWHNVFERGGLESGQWFLVHGGTSGIGVAAIQLATALGAKVIATAGSPEKCEACLKLGAVRAVDYRNDDFVEAVKAETNGRGVNVILDMVGGDYVPRNLACLADDGRHVSIAFQRGGTAEIPIADIMRRRLTLTGSTLRPRDVVFKTMVADELARTVWPYAEGNRLKPVIDSTFPLAEAAAAHARMESGEHIGKIVLQVG